MLAIKTILVFLVAFVSVVVSDDLQIDVTYLPPPADCALKTRKGDKLSLQWVQFPCFTILRSTQNHWSGPGPPP